jgi:hypothetical protein
MSRTIAYSQSGRTSDTCGRNIPTSAAIQRGSVRLNGNSFLLCSHIIRKRLTSNLSDAKRKAKGGPKGSLREAQDVVGVFGRYVLDVVVISLLIPYGW